MRIAVVVSLWVLIGFATAVVMRRRGHDAVAWAAVGIVFGPFAVPLASAQLRRALWVRPRTLARGAPGHGTLDVLVGIDGSPDAHRALTSAVERLGPAMRRLTLAMVVDADAALDLDTWGGEGRCRATLEEHAALTGDLEAATVLLAGDPARALGDYAAREGYDVIVVGPRGHGLSDSLLGSVTRRLARSADTPVLVGPEAATDRTDLTTAT